MAKLKKYDLYKNSGVSWLGEIPEHWEVKKLKFNAKIETGNSISDGNKSNYENIEVESYPYVSTKDINYEYSIINYDNGLKIPVNQTNFKVAHSNTTLICIEGGSAGKKIAFNTQNICHVNKLASLETFNNNPKYLYYLTKSNLFKIQFDLSMNGLIGGVSVSIMKNFELIFPPIQEQQKIAQFLDEKTNQIDQAVTQKQKLIELLKEQKQIVINDAVTKGLDPNVELKESGIEWIGKIPNKWKKTKLKFVTKQIVDGTHFTPAYQDKGIVFLRVTDLKNKSLDLSKVKYITEKEHKELIKRCNPEKGDLLLSKNGTIGATKIVDWDFQFSIFVSLCLIKIKRQLLIPELLEYQIQSEIFTQQLVEAGKTTSVTNLHLEMIKDLIVLIPPIQEQQKIADYLDSKITQIDHLISLAQKQIEKLQEYKTVLIDNVVTGKVRV